MVSIRGRDAQAGAKRQNARTRPFVVAQSTGNATGGAGSASDRSQSRQDEQQQNRRNKTNRGKPRQQQQQQQQQKLEERVIEVKRVCKVIQGGRSVSFRACVAVGDRAGTIGIGVERAKEVAEAIEKARNKALRTKTKVYLTKSYSVPHASKVKGDGGSEIDIFPAGVGTGVNAGGACRSVCELAGVQNVFVKQRRTRNYINNAKSVLQGLQAMHNPEDERQMRGFDSLAELYSANDDPELTNV